ncbi:MULTISPECIES: hypothetical protein [unclassified Roseofilum]|uniref:hypothetical protein n=1 Tax=unclassified Roseofilum TaxID=2620099 RepID=UPI000E8A1181|nr:MULTISPECIES: hypothetical protein [unclassified Roseofilum]MBP0007756.1 hypothetical protein [Roseofilum sp. Belize Diploria]MBP0032149.1 hypothetical protein [Roseofilum sp. Belize BBD 4]HBQ99206.1 hypothetical protein [Cyanobacteria bacterium UBA11691]
MSNTLISVLALTGLTLIPLGAFAQTPTLLPIDPEVRVEVEDIFSLSRAKNLARQAAEQANGGLSKYRAESSMHGDATSSPFVDNEDGSWMFKFYGGEPVFSVPTVESVVTVAKDGSWVRVDYNGPIRE